LFKLFLARRNAWITFRISVNHYSNCENAEHITQIIRNALQKSPITTISDLFTWGSARVPYHLSDIEKGNYWNALHNDWVVIYNHWEKEILNENK